MNSESGQTTSIWMATTDREEFSPLAEDTNADVCIVGAGIAGMTTAYLLVREGNSVVVLDDGPVGGGMTERTTAHLSNAFDDRYSEMERIHGEEGARLLANSHTLAIDRIEEIVNREQIECDFERLDGFLFTPPGESKQILEDELKAAHRAGLEEVEQVARAPIESFDTETCLRFPRQGQFHPMKYLAGLARAITRDGGRIFTGTHAAEIEGGPQSHVKTSDGFTVAARAIVVATNTPVNDLVAIHTKQAPYTSYVIGARVPTGSITRALYWDTLDPYHYVRLQTISAEESRSGESYEVLIVGGEDHKSGQEDDAPERYARLEKWMRERFPMAETVVHRWSGQVMESVRRSRFHRPQSRRCAKRLYRYGRFGTGHDARDNRWNLDYGFDYGERVFVGPDLRPVARYVQLCGRVRQREYQRRCAIRCGLFDGRRGRVCRRDRARERRNHPSRPVKDCRLSRRGRNVVRALGCMHTPRMHSVVEFG